jgi:prophage antirepressor-like protein
MNNQIIPFDFENNPVRIMLIDGQEWWVARDVAVALGYKSPNRAFHLHCKGIPKWNSLETDGGTQKMRIINEGDVWRLITHSNLPEAQRFEKWLFEEVLPQIRKTGAYIPERMTPVNADVAKNMIDNVVACRKQLAETAALIKDAAPRVKLVTSENARLRQMNRLYEEMKSLREQLARKNTPITESEKQRILMYSTHWSVAEIARYMNRSESAVRRVLKRAGVKRIHTRSEGEDTV